MNIKKILILIFIVSTSFEAFGFPTVCDEAVKKIEKVHGKEKYLLIEQTVSRYCLDVNNQIKYSYQLIHYADSIGNGYLKDQGYFWLANYYRRKGYYDAALNILNSYDFPNFRKMNNYKTSSVMLLYAMLNSEIGNLNKGTEYFIKANRAFDFEKFVREHKYDVNNDSIVYLYDFYSAMLEETAEHYVRIGNTEEAKKTYRRSIEINKIEDEYIEVAIQGAKLAMLELSYDDPKLENKLLEYIDLMQKRSNNNCDYEQAVIQKMLGDIFYTQKKYIKALAAYQWAFKTFKEYDFNNEMNDLRITIAKTYYQLNNLDAALEILTENASITSKESQDEMAAEQRLLIKIRAKQNGITSIDSMFDDYELHLKTYYQELYQRAALQERYEQKSVAQEKQLSQAQIENQLNQKYLLIGLISSITIISLLTIFGYITLKKHRIEKDLRKKIDETLNKEMQLKKDLQESISNLKEANIMKDKLLALLVHDIKNPLSIVNSSLELVLDGQTKIPEEQKEPILQNVLRSSQSMLILVNDILNWSKTLNTDTAVITEPIGLHYVVQRTYQLNEFYLENKKIKFTNDVQNDIFVKANEAMLTTVLRNLLSNAIKFSSFDDSISIWNKIDGDKVIIGITDTGIGLDEEVIQKLRNFSKIQSKTGTQGETGIGLGLMMCRDFLHKMGTELEFESKQNKGTTFWFKLDRVTENNEYS